jgi:hypothetical protein
MSMPPGVRGGHAVGSARDSFAMWALGAIPGVDSRAAVVDPLGVACPADMGALDHRRTLPWKAEG